MVVALTSTGLFLDLAQIGAWANMYRNNLRDMSAGQAWERTFSEEGRCPLCESIAQVRQAEEEGPLPLAYFGSKWGWLLPIGIRPSLVNPPPGERMAFRPDDVVGTVRGTGPPDPPPRG